MRTILKHAMWLAVLAVPAIASAQGMPAQATDRSWYLSPLAGVTFGGDTTTSGSTAGLVGGWHGAGWFSAEAEVAYTPHLFEQTGFLIDRSAITGSGSLLVGMPMGRHTVMPYIAIGAGSLHPRLTEAGGFSALDTHRPAINIGGGIMTRGWDRLGLRGDVRYIRGMGNEDDDLNAFDVKVSTLKFWRVSGGLVAWF